MSKVFIEETTLTAIGDAIREKTGKTELIAPLSMATEISSITTGGGGGEDIEPIVLTGNCEYACQGQIPSNYIQLFGNTITTKDITNLTRMFQYYSNPTVPFAINCKSNQDTDAKYVFYQSKIEQLPKINNLKPMTVSGIFQFCRNLAYIPEDYFDSWDFTYIESLTSTYSGSMSSLFSGCDSLRKIPKEILKHGNKRASQSYNIFFCLADNCVSLDELVDVPFIYATVNQTTNLFHNTVKNCSRLKNFTFEMPDGEPIIANMKSQTIELQESGYCYVISNADRIANSSTNGITRDDFVKDDTTYQALKDTNNWYTAKPEYSRYNRISAVNTINSLPDTSAYLAANGGTNTIKFKGAAGSLTDGGAINTMTEEEIAVATAKGWTVSFV